MKKNIVTSEFQKKKREKFIELAESRVKKTITNLRLIGNLSRKNNYEYTNEDVKKCLSLVAYKQWNLDEISQGIPFDYYI